MAGSVSQQIPVAQSSNPSLVMMTSNPSMQSIQALNTNTGSNILKIICVILVFFAIGAILLSVGLYKSQKNEMLKAKELAEQTAAETRYITAQPYIPEDTGTIANEAIPKEDDFISFSLFTTPPGADVYANSVFIGTTPIEQHHIKKSNDLLKLIVVHEGYTIVRKSIPCSDNFSDAITLTGITAAVPLAKQEEVPQNEDVPQNNVEEHQVEDTYIPLPDDDIKALQNSHTKINTQDSDIALPD